MSAATSRRVACVVVLAMSGLLVKALPAPGAASKSETKEISAHFGVGTTISSASCAQCGPGGTPTTYDRLLALRFGSAAVRAIADGAFGTMVGLNGQDITRVPLESIVGLTKNVPLDSDTIRTARDLGISLGD